MTRTLEEMKISRKNLRRLASERSQLYRDAYFLEFSKYAYEQIVYLDESAANEHTTWRKRGYLPHRIKPQVHRPIKRSERYSIMPTYTYNGVLTYTVQSGSITGGKFRRFLKHKVPPRCNRFPGPR